MDGGLVAGFVLLVLGGFQVVRPSVVLALESWVLERVTGRTLKTDCAKNQRIVRSVGVALVVFALLLLTRAIP